MHSLPTAIGAILIAFHPTGATAYDRNIAFLGPERRVNHTVALSQHHCSVGAGADGDVVVAYTSGDRTGNVITRHLDGEEVTLATADELASHPQLRTLGSQTWVAYTDNMGAWITEFARDGSLSERLLLAKGSGLGQPQLPDFAIDPTREQLLAIWNRKHTHVGTIEARMVGFDGRLGATFRFRTSGSALGPAAVVRTRANAFLVAWSEFLEDGSNLLLGQRVVDGRPHGLVVPMTEATMTYHRRVKLGQLGESRAVFTWSETDPVTLASYGAYFSLVDERLSLLVSRVRIDDDRAGHQPEVAGCADEFVVAWDQDGDGLFAGRDVMIQLFSSDGAPLSDITQANNHIANDQKQPDLFVDCDSGRVVGGGLTWDSKNQDGDGRGVFARWFIVD